MELLSPKPPKRSGTLNTASHALNQGRDLFVIPGNITSPLSAGCNTLLKQGAYLVTDADDVLSIIAPEKLQKDNGQELATSATIEEGIIIKLISEGCVTATKFNKNPDYPRQTSPRRSQC